MSKIERIPTSFSCSSAVSAGDYVFLGVHRGDGEDFITQFGDIINNLEKSLAEFDLPLGSLVKVNVWLKHISDLPEMENLFLRYFKMDHFPARMTSTTEFSDDNCLLMMDGIAYRE